MMYGSQYKFDKGRSYSNAGETIVKSRKRIWKRANVLDAKPEFFGNRVSDGRSDEKVIRAIEENGGLGCCL